MGSLLMEDPQAPQGSTVGGTPLAPRGTPWPTCRTCGAHMQFLAQFPLRHAEPALARFQDQVLMLFQCQNQPGLCDEWNSESGGNAAILVSASGRLPLPVPQGPTLL